MARSGQESGVREIPSAPFDEAGAGDGPTRAPRQSSTLRMNDRRRLLILLCASVLAPRGASAQAKQPVLIGWLHAGSRESNRRSFAAFKEGLAALGWEEGSQVVIDERWSAALSDRLPP